MGFFDKPIKWHDFRFGPSWRRRVSRISRNEKSQTDYSGKGSQAGRSQSGRYLTFSDLEKREIRIWQLPEGLLGAALWQLGLLTFSLLEIREILHQADSSALEKIADACDGTMA